MSPCDTGVYPPPSLSPTGLPVGPGNGEEPYSSTIFSREVEPTVLPGNSWRDQLGDLPVVFGFTVRSSMLL